MMSIFVCEEEELEHKVEKIDDEDDCYGSSEDMTESQLNASLYILGQAHYSWFQKSDLCSNMQKSRFGPRIGLWKKVRPKAGFFGQKLIFGTVWVKLCQSHDYLCFIFYEQDVILSCLHSWETPL